MLALRFCSLALLLVASTSATFAQDAPKKDEPANLVKPSDKAESWRFEKAEGGKGELKIEEEWAVFKVTEVTGTDWHVQAVLADVELKEGKTYQLTFELKAEKPRGIMINAMIDQDDWHEIGLHEDIFVGTKPQKEEFKFTAYGVADKKKNRISFVFGTETGTVYVKNVKLVEMK